MLTSAHCTATPDPIIIPWEEPQPTSAEYFILSRESSDDFNSFHAYQNGKFHFSPHTRLRITNTLPLLANKTVRYPQFYTSPPPTFPPANPSPGTGPTLQNYPPGDTDLNSSRACLRAQEHPPV